MSILVIKFTLQSHIVAISDEIVPLVNINACAFVGHNLRIISIAQIKFAQHSLVLPHIETSWIYLCHLDNPIPW